MIKRMLGLCDCKGCFAKARVWIPVKTNNKRLIVMGLCNSCNEEYKKKGYIKTR